MIDLDEILRSEKVDFFDQLDLENLDIDFDKFREKDNEGMELWEHIGDYSICFSRHDYEWDGNRHNYWISIHNETLNVDPGGRNPSEIPGYIFAVKSIEDFDKAVELYLAVERALV